MTPNWFAREEFALERRYAMVVHNDEPHPHVHVVIEAVSEQGVRLNIRKATLRDWRREFARHLRAHGVEANAGRAPYGASRVTRRPRLLTARPSRQMFMRLTAMRTYFRLGLNAAQTTLGAIALLAGASLTAQPPTRSGLKPAVTA